MKTALEIAKEIQRQYNNESLEQNFAHLANDLCEAVVKLSASKLALENENERLCQECNALHAHIKEAQNLLEKANALINHGYV